MKQHDDDEIDIEYVLARCILKITFVGMRQTKKYRNISEKGPTLTKTLGRIQFANTIPVDLHACGIITR
jgi:hypothetical protein